MSPIIACTNSSIHVRGSHGGSDTADVIVAAAVTTAADVSDPTSLQAYTTAL
jgi:hypothetical protein